MKDPLSFFHPAVLCWFRKTYEKPTLPQEEAWPLIARGDNVLLLAPTGSGKTLSAFLYALSWLYSQALEERPPQGPSVLYISPLKALNNDIHINLERPLSGIEEEGRRMGLSLPSLGMAVRTGDTPSKDRVRMVKNPPHILITTPESLFLMLSSKAHEILKEVQFLILDEIHSLFPNKRGAHLALSLARLEALLGDRKVQKIGLSATMAPLEKVAEFLGGVHSKVKILQIEGKKELDLKLLLPVEDLTNLPGKSIWPSIYSLLIQLISGYKTTLIFVNSRRLAERVTSQLNALSEREVARTHHGSISKEVRLQVEDLLRNGEISCLVATSTLELGIDIGSIEQVIQIGSPQEVARGLQRFGRSGHVFYQKSRGRLIPLNPGDLLESAVLLNEMKKGELEEKKAPLNPLDVLAQHLVAMTATRSQELEEMYLVVRKAYNFATLKREDFILVLEMLSGIWRGRGLIDFKPRIYWDESKNTLEATPYGKQLVYTGSGTIPYRGYYKVVLEEEGVILGELDEEFVFERRIGHRFLLGTSTWQIQEIKEDRVLVTPSPGEEAHVPFWRAEEPGRTFHLGRKVGEFLNLMEGFFQEGREASFIETWLQKESLLHERGARALYLYLKEGREALHNLPTNRHLILEEFLMEGGDRGILLHSPYGRAFHFILALLFREELERDLGFSLQYLPGDNGLLFRLPEGTIFPGLNWESLAGDLRLKLALLLTETPLFRITFRHSAQRALLLPKGDVKGRSPLWLSRLKASDLLEQLRSHQDYPLIQETYREIFEDYLPVDEIPGILASILGGEIQIASISRSLPSPFATTHLFHYVGQFMYQDDTPRKRMKFQYSHRLKEVSPKTYPGIPESVVHEVLKRVRGVHGSTLTPKEILSFFQRHGDLLWEEIPQFFSKESFQVISTLLEEKRLLSLKSDAKTFLITPAMAPIYLGAIPRAKIQGGDALPLSRFEAISFLVRQYIRAHGPFTTEEIVRRYGLSFPEIEENLTRLVAEGILVKGVFSISQKEEEWCDRVLFQEMERVNLQKRRKRIQSRSITDYALFLGKWQKAINRGDLRQILFSLQDLFLPVNLWENIILPSRISSYEKKDLDQLLSSGQIFWQAKGSFNSFLLSFFSQETLLTGEIPTLSSLRKRPLSMEKKDLSNGAKRIQEILANQGALFLPAIIKEMPFPTKEIFASLEELLYAGLLTNDTFGPIRILLSLGEKDTKGAWGYSKEALTQMGRWSLLHPSYEEDLLSQVYVLLNRYGILSSTLVKREGKSWSHLYPILKELELLGEIYGGFFFQGLGGIQFALPEVLEMFQDLKEEDVPSYQVLAWADPANFLPFFSSKERGDWVVFQGKKPLLCVSGRELKITTFDVVNPFDLEEGLKILVKTLHPFYGGEKMVVKEFNGLDVIDTPLAKVLERIGFERVYRSLILWPSLRKKE